MAWGTSSIFRQFIADMAENATAFDLGADTIKAALYDNDITPDNDVSAANSAYNAGQWTASGNEVSESGQWAAGGVALGSQVIDVSVADVTFFDAANTASGSAADLAAVFGVLVYDDTLTTPVADQGICFNYLGGSNSVVNGVFTVIWHANGVWRVTTAAA